MNIKLNKALQYIKANEFDLLKVHSINETVTWGDLLHGLIGDKLLLLDNNTLIKDLYELADLINTFKHFYGDFKLRARSSYIENNGSLGLRFIPRGILTYKLKECVEEFAKKYVCEYEVCDSYIYLGVKRSINLNVDATKKENDETGSIESESKTNKNTRRK